MKFALLRLGIANEICSALGFYVYLHTFFKDMTIQDNNEIIRLKEAVAETFGKTLDSPADFDALALAIQGKTGEYISPTTLKRLFGYVKPATVPRTSTLSVLARYVGKAGWSDFSALPVHQEPADQPGQSNPPEPSAPVEREGGIRKYLPLMIAATILLIGIVAVLVFMRQDGAVQERPAGPEETGISIQAKYDAILEECIDEAEKRCTEVLDKKNSMDTRTYYKYVYAEYTEIVFTDLKKLVSEKTAEAFPDESLRQKFELDIFSKCRDYCMNRLLRGLYQ